MVRFYISSSSIAGVNLRVTGENFHYLKNVLRVEKGESVKAFDGTGKEYLCTVDEIHSHHIEFSITRTLNCETEPVVEIHLVQSLIKMGHFEHVLQKCTELGVRRFIPAVTERTVVKLEGEREKNRRLRWQKLVREAARQCGRGICPDVEPVMDFKDALKSAQSCDISIIPWEEEESLTLGKAIRGVKGNPEKAMVFIGPEGGFSIAEISSARESGVVPVSLGPRLLRSETAAIAVVSVLMYEFEDGK
jgi:16S rRNA (uracil1498-N3)-methyltransferase